MCGCRQLLFEADEVPAAFREAIMLEVGHII